MPNDRVPYFITTAIPYVNARPHIGFALEIVLTDALARYHRLKGEDVRFLTGTDDNSLSNVRAAEEEGVPTGDLVDRYATDFQNLRGPLNLSFDDFIRTSAEERHLDGVKKLWEACDASGDIYKKPYRGLYCVGCEVFYTEDELQDGLCPEHLTRPEIVEEENYFFRLSRYQDDLLDLISSDRLRVIPQTRRNEVLSFIKTGLQDFSISRSRERSRGWGVPVPGDPGQVMYVWFDALGNYITALDYATDGPLYRRYWLDNPNRIHVIGKDIIRFHAVYWPAMLLSAGVPLPRAIVIHGFLTIEGQKMSKSLGNVIDPVDWVSRYGTDALRHYLLRFSPWDDGDVNEDGFIRTYNADLADQLGNLLSRVVGMVVRYYDGVVPAPAEPGEAERRLIEKAGEAPGRIDEAVSRFAPNEALAAIWALVGAANKYVVEVEPWALDRRRGSDEAAEAQLATALYTLAEVLRLVAHLCAPFIPETAEAICEQIGIQLQAEGDWQEVTGWGRYPAGTALRPGEVLFPKLEAAPTSAT